MAWEVKNMLQMMILTICKNRQNVRNMHNMAGNKQICTLLGFRLVFGIFFPLQKFLTKWPKCYASNRSRSQNGVWIKSQTKRGKNQKFASIVANFEYFVAGPWPIDIIFHFRSRTHTYHAAAMLRHYLVKRQFNLTIMFKNSKF